MKLLVKLVTLAALPCLLVGGCAAEVPPHPAAVRLGADVDAETLDPRLMRNTTAYRVNNLLYDGLVELDADLTARPGLAESWETPEPTVWIFHLRDGVRFHDGTALSAEDVVYTFETILDPTLRARFRSLYEPMRKIEATDRLTVRIELSEPYAPLLRYLDVGIVPKSYVEAGGDLSTRPVGTGPMKLVEWARGSRIVLEAFEDYWGGKPRVERFEFVIVGDNTARAQAFEAGDLDVIQSPLSPQDIRRLSSDRGFSGSEVEGLGITYLNFNSAAPHLRDPAMRRALAMLVDQETIVNTIYEGVDRVATSILLPSSWTYTDSIRQPTFDPGAARDALAALGWRDRDGDGMLDRGGERLTVELSTHSEDPNRIQTLEFIQSVFRENGVDARLSLADWPAFFARVQGGQHQIALLGWTNIVDPDRLMYAQLRSGGDLNYGGYANAEVDVLLQRGRAGSDPSVRGDAYRAAAAIIARELPYFVISYQDYQVFHADHLTLEANARGLMRSVIGF